MNNINENHMLYREEENEELIMFDFSNKLIELNETKRKQIIKNGFKDKIVLFFNENFMTNFNEYKYTKQNEFSYKKYIIQDDSKNEFNKNIEILLNNYNMLKEKIIFVKSNNEIENLFNLLILLDVNVINVSEHIGNRKNLMEQKDKFIKNELNIDFNFNSISYIENKYKSKYFYSFQKDLNILFIFEFNQQDYNGLLKLVLKKENYTNNNDIQIYELNKYNKEFNYLKINIEKIMNTNFDLFYLFRSYKINEPQKIENNKSNIFYKILKYFRSKND